MHKTSKNSVSLCPDMNTIKAKKAFGQNFLINSAVIDKIIQAMPNNKNLVVEIGPGLGDLTKHLVPKRRVVAFEVDTDLCTHLTTVFEQALASKQLTLKCGDVLQVWQDSGQTKSLVDVPYDLVANLPYYIGTTIILHALRDINCRNILVMVQKEVADKFSAQTGEKAFSALSVLTQTVGSAQRVITVPPTAFEPQPKVDSTVIAIRKDSATFDEGFADFLKICFAQPRKTLAKNLTSHFEKATVSQLLLALNLSPTVRAHETTTQQFHQIYNQLKGMLDGREQQQREQSK